MRSVLSYMFDVQLLSRHHDTSNVYGVYLLSRHDVSRADRYVSAQVVPVVLMQLS